MLEGDLTVTKDIILHLTFSTTATAAAGGDDEQIECTMKTRDFIDG
jgi:hypothetical protein